MPRSLRTSITPSCHAASVLIVIALFAAHANAERDPIRLTHGPMLGHPTAHSVKVWARTSDAGVFVVRFGTQVIFQYYDGRTGELDYAEAISVDR